MGWWLQGYRSPWPGDRIYDRFQYRVTILDNDGELVDDFWPS